MQQIFQKAKRVLVWLGTDSQVGMAQAANSSLIMVSDFLCQRLAVSVTDLVSMKDIYQEAIIKNREKLPLPNECSFNTDTVWRSLNWLYSHSYFTRVWVIQEVNASKERWVHFGDEKIEWELVELVAGYIIMETAVSKSLGFTGAFCWWAAMVGTERIRQPKHWLSMLYLASNFSSMDSRDRIYGLRGLMMISDDLLSPDYSKTAVEVYRDSVEAAFVHFRNTDVLLYVTGEDEPSWIPRWDRAMLFRNPFRFGKELPWKPAPESSQPIWSINKTQNVLSLSGFVIDHIRSAEPYNQSIFGNALTKSQEARATLKGVWHRILTNMSDGSHTPLNPKVLAAAAASFSFGLDENSFPASEEYLMFNFVAYLKIVLDEETFDQLIPSQLAANSETADGHAFGTPVWDFKYPESSFFIARNGLVGCCISTTAPGDVVCVVPACTYPLVLRSDGGHFRVRGYAYVHGVMLGECHDLQEQVFKIM